MKVKVTACKCERCNHIWIPRGYPKNRTSKKCPSCGSFYWNTPRSRPVKKVEPNNDFLAPKVYSKQINKTFKDDTSILSELMKTMKPKAETVEPEVEAKKEIEIVGKEPPKKNNLDILKRNCYTCREKYKTDDGKWHCTFFNYKDKPKYDRCRLCYELPEIWGKEAVGYKEREEKGKNDN